MNYPLRSMSSNPTYSTSNSSYMPSTSHQNTQSNYSTLFATPKTHSPYFPPNLPSSLTPPLEISPVSTGTYPPSYTPPSLTPHDILGLKSLPLLYERIKRLGWIHQNMVLFLVQRAIMQYCPEIHEPHLSILCDAIIQSCLKLQIHPKNATISFILRDDIRSEKDFVNALLFYIQSADNNLRPNPVKISSANVAEFDENSSEMVKFLAFIRKMGMDLLFPLHVQDKILIAIYQGIKETNRCPHRDLIERVMSLKAYGLIGQHETVTKTKIRGLLALLKHANILFTESVEGTPVQLCMSEDIDSFRTLRHFHDQFLITQITKCHSKFERNHWKGILWNDAPDWIQSRCEWANGFMEKIDRFHHEQPHVNFFESESISRQRSNSQSQNPHRSVYPTDSKTSRYNDISHTEEYLRRAIPGKQYHFTAVDMKNPGRGVRSEDAIWRHEPRQSRHQNPETPCNHYPLRSSSSAAWEGRQITTRQGITDGISKNRSYFPEHERDDTYYPSRGTALFGSSAERIPIAEGIEERWEPTGSTSGDMSTWSCESNWEVPPGFSSSNDENGSQYSLFQSTSTDWLDIKKPY